MDLTLEYMPDKPEQPEIEQQDYAQPVFKSSSNKMKSKRGISNGSSTVDAGLSAGWDAWGGQTMANGREGCAEFVGKCGSYYSPFLAQEAENGIGSCLMIRATCRKAMSWYMETMTMLSSTTARAATTEIAQAAM